MSAAIVWVLMECTAVGGLSCRPMSGWQDGIKCVVASYQLGHEMAGTGYIYLCKDVPYVPQVPR